jgi:hypothetical protein
MSDDYYADILPPVIRIGLYLLQSGRARVEQDLFQRGRRTLLLPLAVVGGPVATPRDAIDEGGPHHGVGLFWAAKLPLPNRRPPISSKFARTWMLLAGRRPRRGERMTSALFEHKRVLGSVRTVVHDHNGRPLPEWMQYSVCQDLVAWG